MPGGERQRRDEVGEAVMGTAALSGGDRNI